MNDTIITASTDLATLPRFADDRGRTVDAGKTRVYFYDLATRREMTEHALNGAAVMGVGANTVVDGRFVRGTAQGVCVVVKGRIGLVNRDTFPGRRVAAKIWRPGEEPEWRLLAPEADISRAHGASPITAKEYAQRL